jgi:hypothetical protein
LPWNHRQLKNHLLKNIAHTYADSLSFNSIGYDGYKELTLALHTNTSLTSLK